MIQKILLRRINILIDGSLITWNENINKEANTCETKNIYLHTNIYIYIYIYIYKREIMIYIH